ncbi:MAG: hypothetical protein CVU77_04330 [Elusimicrobia bacterium HGW-Elusimicrobia-1]|jgi:RNA polymerase subunit RPABC4/transcription elongation factor Spt4|nr:MAG: hypothetical protein CVU77_04330 [Elusimicrobia bacterium HGW-Elusimicrobia-1]
MEIAKEVNRKTKKILGPFSLFVLLFIFMFLQTPCKTYGASSSSGGVTVFDEFMQDENNVVYGANYYATNSNSYEVDLFFYAKSQTNTQYSINNQTRLSPNQKLRLGWVVAIDKTKHWELNWNFSVSQVKKFQPLQSKKQCPSCSELIPSEAKFCPKCGSNLIKKQKQCPSCSKSVPPAVKFCPDCGSEVK